VGCLENAPAKPTIPEELGTDDHTTDPACPEKWELCADWEAAGKIDRYVREAQRYIRQVEILCGKPKEGGPDDKSTDSD